MIHAIIDIFCCYCYTYHLLHYLLFFITFWLHIVRFIIIIIYIISLLYGYRLLLLVHHVNIVLLFHLYVFKLPVCYCCPIFIFDWDYNKNKSFNYVAFSHPHDFSLLKFFPFYCLLHFVCQVRLFEFMNLLFSYHSKT